MEKIFELKFEAPAAFYIVTLVKIPKWIVRGITIEEFDAMTKEEIAAAENEEGFLDALAETLVNHYKKEKNAKRRF